MKKINILITGIAGFIGSNLAERILEKGRKFKIIGIDNLSYGVKEQVPKDAEFYKLDIRSKKIYPLFKNVDYVFHLAAKNCISDCQKDPLGTADININGAINIFEAARLNKVKKIIYAESSAIYEGSNIFPTPESEEKPISFYGCSKLCESHFAKSYSKAYGIKITGLRYFNVYGPKQDYRRTVPPVMSAFIISLFKGRRPVIYGNGRKKRDFIYVDDVNDFHILAMEDSRTDGNIYNLGSGINYSIRDIFNFIKKSLKSNISPRYLEDLPGEAQITLADISKARRLGWKPRTKLQDGIAITVNYIKNNVIGNI